MYGNALTHTKFIVANVIVFSQINSIKNGRNTVITDTL